MADLYPACESLIENETNRLVALGVFAMANGHKPAKLADGSIIQVERTRKIRPLRETSTESPAIAGNDDFDAITVDGNPGTAERIAALGQYYRDNGESAIADVLTDSEVADRLVSIIPSWAEIPASKRTPFQSLMMALAAESCLDLEEMQKLIVAQLGS